MVGLQFVVEDPCKINDLGIPLFQEASIYLTISQAFGLMATKLIS